MNFSPSVQQDNYEYSIGSKVEAWVNSCWLTGVVKSALNSNYKYN